MSKNWYVYAHYKKSNGELFYIGIGTGNRKNDVKSRNSTWTRQALESGYTVEVLSRFNNREDAVLEELRSQCLHRPSACIIYGDGPFSIDAIKARSLHSKGGLESVLKELKNPEAPVVETVSTMTKDELIKSSAAGYTVVPNELFSLKISPAEMRVMLAICKWENQPNKPLSLTYLQYATGITRRQISRLKQSLLNQGLIIESKVGQTNSYKVDWKKVKAMTSLENRQT